MRIYQAIIVLMIGILFLIPILGLAAEATNEVEASTDDIMVKAKVIKSDVIQEVQEDNTTTEVQKMTVRIQEGEYENEEYEMNYVLSQDAEGIASHAELKEEDSILVVLQEKEGEVTGLQYQETIPTHYALYVILVVLVAFAFILGRKKAIPFIAIYLLVVFLTIFLWIWGMKLGWNLILVGGILSFIITVGGWLANKGFSRKTLLMVLYSILGISIAGLGVYVLFDMMGLSNINIRIGESATNIKDLVCSASLLFSTGICYTIIANALKLYENNQQSYKTKSDNIIEGQRSLKL